MITINLLPVREERRKASARQFLLVMLAATGASMALSALHHWWYQSEVQAARTAAANIQREIDAYAPQLAQVEKFRAVKADIEQKLRVIDELSVARTGPVHLFDEIATHLPERMWLTQLEVNGQSLSLQGVSLDNELVALFLTAMNASPYFENVELLETAAKEIDGYKLNAFELSAVLSGTSVPETETESAPASTPGPTGPGKTAQSTGAAPAIAAR